MSHDTVTIVVSSAFASYWLLPRMSRFQALHPKVELRVLTSDRTVDLLAERIPLAIRHGDGTWPDCDAWRIAREAVFPVCAPHYLKKHGPIRSAKDLSSHRLIEFRERHRRHLMWQDWFREGGIQYRRPVNRLDFTDYALVLKAALSGEGIALGWVHLVGDLLAEGHLVAPVEPIVTTRSAYWLITPRSMPATTATLCLRDWLLDEAQRAQGNSAASHRTCG